MEENGYEPVLIAAFIQIRIFNKLFKTESRPVKVRAQKTPYTILDTTGAAPLQVKPVNKTTLAEEP